MICAHQFVPHPNWPVRVCRLCNGVVGERADWESFEADAKARGHNKYHWLGNREDFLR